MNTTQSIQKWSIGTDIRLPRDVAERAHLSLSEPLEVNIKEKVVILTPLNRKEKITLKDLLADVTPERVGGELAWGQDTGAEVYE